MKIENIDLKETFSATLLEESYKSVIEFPSIKKPSENNWNEHNGVEVDLTEVFLDSRKLKLEILIYANKLQSFINLLESKTTLLVYFEELDISLNLRFIEIENIDNPQGVFSINVVFSEDIPTLPATAIQPNLNANDQSFFIDTINVNKFGLIPLEDSFTQLDESYILKEKLEIGNNYSTGKLVPEQISKRQERSVQLDFFIKQNVIDFKNAYYNFFKMLIIPNERMISYDGKTYLFYYEKSNVKELFFDNGLVWCNFTVNIILI